MIAPRPGDREQGTTRCGALREGAPLAFDSGRCTAARPEAVLQAKGFS